MQDRKTVIQVPMDEALLKELDRLAEAERRSRAAVIREACRRYAEERERARLDRAYEEGYRRLPEDTAVGEAQSSLAADVLPEESW